MWDLGDFCASERDFLSGFWTDFERILSGFFRFFVEYNLLMTIDNLLMLKKILGDFTSVKLFFKMLMVVIFEIFRYGAGK